MVGTDPEPNSRNTLTLKNGMTVEELDKILLENQRKAEELEPKKT